MAAKTKTADRTRGKDKIAEPAKNAGTMVPTNGQQETQAPRGLRLRIPFPRVWAEQNAPELTAAIWQVYIDAVWPSARTLEAVCMALMYCKGRHLDPMKKMVHIVPMWSKDAPVKEEGKNGGWIETVWPSIAEIRVTATRTNHYAGKDATKFGDLIEHEFTHTYGGDTTKKTVIYPEWAEVTVYRIVQGVRCAFVGPKVYWLESYATESKWSEVPNEMWGSRPSGQLEKCAEAAALRAAFPEELGNEYASEEMHGKTIEHQPLRTATGTPLLEGEVRPQSNGKAEEFQRKEPEKPKADAKPAAAAETPKGDPRPEPPVEGEPAKSVPETPPVDDAQSDEDLKALDLILDKSLERLGQVAKVGQLADLRDEIEQELPPESEHLKKWLKACEVKQEQIVKAGKVKK